MLSHLDRNRYGGSIAEIPIANAPKFYGCILGDCGATDGPSG
jgi:hypothetical protein